MVQLVVIQLDSGAVKFKEAITAGQRDGEAYVIFYGGN
jgi:hypothetical protein